MIKGLVITHGNLGKELVAVAERIMEQESGIDTFSFDWEEDGTDSVTKIERYLRANKEHRIVVFTDMFGGSPTNISIKHQRENVEIITGVNLPGLLKFITYKNKEISFETFATIVKKGAIDGINLISEYLGVKKK